MEAIEKRLELVTKREELVAQYRLIEATFELEEALRRYAAVVDEIQKLKDGTTLSLINSVLSECKGLPIHNIPSEITAPEEAKQLQEALEQLELAIGQTFQINVDDIIGGYIIDVEPQLKALNKKLSQKRNYPKVKTKCKPIAGHTQKPTWNRTRSNPKLR